MPAVVPPRGMSFRVFGSLCGQLLLAPTTGAGNYKRHDLPGFSGGIISSGSVRPGGGYLFASLGSVFSAGPLYNIPCGSGRCLGSLPEPYIVELKKSRSCIRRRHAGPEAFSSDRLGSVGLVGANGAGKSTLLLHLNGWLFRSRIR